MKKLLALTLALFSVIVFATFSASAQNVKTGDNFEITCNKKNQEHSVTFTATTSGWYEIVIDSPLPRDTYVSIFNSDGTEIGFDYWDGTSSKCISAVELVAKQTYTFEITCEAEDNVVLLCKINKHNHNYQINSIDRANQSYAGTIEKECTVCEHIDYFPIPKLNISVSSTELVYNGKVQTPVITVTDANGKAFVKGSDYQITNIKSGAAVASDYSLKVAIINDYYNAFQLVDYKIIPKDISTLSVKLSATTLTFGEKATVKIAGLTQGKDFNFNASYTGIGQHKAVVNGMGNYSGTVSISYNVIPAKVTGLKVAKSTASSIKLAWNKDNSGKTQYYQVYDVKTKKTVTIAAKNLSYTIKDLKAATAYNFKVRSYSEADGKKYYSEWVTISSITKSVSTTLKSLKSEKAKAFIAKWTAKSGVTGYQIQYSLAADFSNAKTVKITDGAATSKTVSSLKSGKKYYVRIRTYKTLKVNGESKTVYSAWSSASSVKVK